MRSQYLPPSPRPGVRVSPLTSARRAWLVLFALVALTFFLSVPLQYAQLHVPCASSNGNDCPNFQLTADNMSSMQAAGVSLDVYALYAMALTVGLMLAFWAVALLIFFSKSRDWMGLLASTTLVFFGLSFANPLAILTEVLPVSPAPVLAISVAGLSLFSIFLLVFPDGRFVPRWTIWLAPLFVVREAAGVVLSDLGIVSLALIAELGLILYVQVYRYRRVSTPVQRQQTKWVVYGLLVAALGLSAFTVFALLPNSSIVGSAVTFMVWGALLYLSISIIPLAIGMAILRSHLWDIDILIRRTLVYAVLSALLALVYFGGVVVLQQVFRAFTGQGSDLAIILSTLAIAALFTPLRGRVQQVIDRRFYRRKYDAQKVLSAFAEAARDEVDLQALSNELIVVVEETVQPAFVTLWLEVQTGPDNTRPAPLPIDGRTR